MTEMVSLTGNPVRLWTSQETAEEQGRKLAHWAMDPQRDEDETYDLVRLHFVNSLDGYSAGCYGSFVHGFFNELAAEQARLDRVAHVGHRVAREVWRENEIRQTESLGPPPEEAIRK